MNETINVLIVEDNSLIAESTKTLLQRNGMSAIGIFNNGEEAIEFVRNQRPDLVLMDITLAGAIDGISAAKIIGDETNVPIIYLTDHGDTKTLQRAKQTFPASYMTKPFNDLDLIRAIEIAFTNSNRQGKSPSNKIVFLRTQTQKYIKLDTADVLYLKAERVYCSVVTVLGSHLIGNSLNHVHEQLSSPELVRVHRSFVVNLKKVTAIDGNMITVGEHEIQMSKDYREAVMDRLKVIR
jgi:DNA-binding LytR/AlgR family response regulator